MTTTFSEIQGKLDLFLKRVQTIRDIPSTGVTKETYLDVIEGNVGYFKQHQNEQGAIIDPVLGEEKQYATPAYAAAAACLVKYRGREDLLSSACSAVTFSLESMVAARCNNHGNFYTNMVVHAVLWLRNIADPALVDKWRELFGHVYSHITYRQAFHNWSVVAQAGETMRLAYGLGGNLEEIDRNIELQRPLFTELGMYVDPNGPLAYDFFSRLYIRMMLNHNYNGRHYEFLTEMSEKGALTSLFLQSPTGEILLGGRSAQHQWNEAEQCYVFETYANEYAKQGRLDLAGIFKRAARLSLASITRWVRPSGELNIVRNRFDPKERVGYEGYSYHSQYNLLCAAMLASCYELSDDGIEERACPAEAGSHVVVLERHFRKVVVNAGGYYAVVQLKGEELYNPTGIIRVQKSGLTQPIGPADMVPLKKQPEGAISYAISTYYRDKWQRLADLTRGELDEVYVDVVEERDGRCVVDLTYIGGLSVNRFKRRLIVDAQGVTVQDESSMNFYEEIPVFLFDGQDESVVSVESRQATVQLRDEKQTITILEPEDDGLTLTERSGMSRNGKLGCLQYATKGSSTSYRIELSKA